jgi:predicted transcriptional regulator
MDPTDTAITTSDLLADLTARMSRVAVVRADAVRSMRAEGMSIRRICDVLGLSRWVVCELLKTDQRSAGATPPNTP